MFVVRKFYHRCLTFLIEKHMDLNKFEMHMHISIHYHVFHADRFKASTMSSASNFTMIKKKKPFENIPNSVRLSRRWPAKTILINTRNWIKMRWNGHHYKIIQSISLYKHTHRDVLKCKENTEKCSESQMVCSVRISFFTPGKNREYIQLYFFSLLWTRNQMLCGWAKISPELRFGGALRLTVFLQVPMHGNEGSSAMCILKVFKSMKVATKWRKWACYGQYMCDSRQIWRSPWVFGLG